MDHKGLLQRTYTYIVIAVQYAIKQFADYKTKTTKIMQHTIMLYTVFQKKSTHIIGYKLRNSCLILIIFDIKIPHIIWHRMTA